MSASPSADRVSRLLIVVRAIRRELGFPLRLTSHNRSDATSHSTGDAIDVGLGSSAFPRYLPFTRDYTQSRVLVDAVRRGARRARLLVVDCPILVLIERDHIHVGYEPTFVSSYSFGIMPARHTKPTRIEKIT